MKHLKYPSEHNMADGSYNGDKPVDPNFGFTFFDAPTHLITRQLFDYWDGLREGDQDVPLIGNFDPLGIAEIMSHIVIADIVDAEKFKYRVRLFGTSLSELAGEDRTGKMLDDFRFGDQNATRLQTMFNRWRLLLSKCIRSRAPNFTTGLHSDAERQYLKVHTAVLPLADENGDITRCVGAMISEPANR